MAETATAQSTFDVYRRAVEAGDVASLLDLYSDDAVVLEYSERSRPGSAEQSGRSKIETNYRDAVENGLTFKIQSEVVGEDRFAFTQVCTYPSWELVVGNHICEVRDGKVVKETAVETWDE
jgi:ketosteroid isomerase-like protein